MLKRLLQWMYMGIIVDCIPEISDFINEVLPKQETDDKLHKELLEIVVDTREYFEEVSCNFL